MWSFLLFIILLGVLSYHRFPLWFASLVTFIYLIEGTILSPGNTFLSVLSWSIVAPILLIINVKPIRRALISKAILAFYKKSKPSMSDTEREALTSGTVGWEADLFSGKPSWDKMLDLKSAKLTKEEQAFLDGPVEELCSMIDDWEITHKLRYIPEKIWEFVRKEKFFGMIIPKKYGGHGLSALAHSEVVAKVSAVSNSVGVMVSVPNSLGPGELILKYGTEEQKDHYLPRLAKGEEVPCFALTSPTAGSDATSITDYGVVCKEKFDGKEQVCIRLNWNKRYITMAPVATILGLAFKLHDPDHLIGNKDEWGITCALVPTNLKGITIGRRHFPLDAAFPNGPTQGKDVIIPITNIIGGPERAGEGWHMLFETLSVGRAISLPAMSAGAAKLGLYAVGAYARIRKQFNLPIGYFEGVEEAISRSVGYVHMIDTTRKFTLDAIDRGEEPAVPAGMSKYFVTEYAREAGKDMMDILGGRAICMGPSNFCAQGYHEMPISITVEGANILTRSMMIFGQGALRCHPYLLKELFASENNDTKQGLKEFDEAIFGHFGYSISNFVRSLWLGLTRSWFIIIPSKVKDLPGMTRYLQQLTHVSAVFAFVSDFALLTLGGQFKRKERLSARFADVFGYLYMASAVLKDYSESENKKQLKPVVDWILQYLLYQSQQRLDEIMLNLPNKLSGKILRWIVYPLGKRLTLPSDALGHEISREILRPGGLRAHIAEGAYLSQVESNAPGYLEKLLEDVLAAEEYESKIQKAVKSGKIKAFDYVDLVHEAVKKKIITKKQSEVVLKANESRHKAIKVDDFAPKELEL